MSKGVTATEILSQEPRLADDGNPPTYQVMSRSAADHGSPATEWSVSHETTDVVEARRVARWMSKQNWTNAMIRLRVP